MPSLRRNPSILAVALLTASVLTAILLLRPGPMPLEEPFGAVGPTDGTSGQTTVGESHGPTSPDSPKTRRAAWRRAMRSSELPLGTTDVAETIEPSASGSEPSSSAWRNQMFDPEGPRPASAEVARDWLASGRTNAADLLALKQAGAGGRELLERALESFPNDPRTILESLSYSKDPEVRRERLERFRAADPDNALPDYLSAINEFKAGHPDRALETLERASAKKGFDDYLLQAARATEEVYLADGRSPVEATALGMSSVVLPHLSELKQLSQEVATLQGQAVAAGDTATAARLAEYVMQLGHHLTDGGGSMTLIGELVGFAVEKKVLKQLPSDGTYGFLDGTPAERLEAIEARLMGAKGFAEEFETWARRAPDTDVIEYFQRVQRDGEHAALVWMRMQVPKKP